MDTNGFENVVPVAASVKSSVIVTAVKVAKIDPYNMKIGPLQYEV